MTAMNPIVARAGKRPRSLQRNPRVSRQPQARLPPSATHKPCEQRTGNFGGRHVFLVPVARVRTFVKRQSPVPRSRRTTQSLLPFPHSNKRTWHPNARKKDAQTDARLRQHKLNGHMILAEDSPNLMQRLPRLPASPHVVPLLLRQFYPPPLSHKHNS
jgi:hypothetical protein